MATDNRLTASVPEEWSREIHEISEQRDTDKTEAERAVVREGLRAMDRLERPSDPADVLLEYARKIGSILGFVGLILIGYGIFGTAAFRYMGFGLTLAGFAFIAGAEFVPVVFDRFGGDAE